MKLTPWYLAALAPIAVAGCSGALMGHVAVLAVAIGIFVGTLSLGRQRVPSPLLGDEISAVDLAKSAGSLRPAADGPAPKNDAA
ncbi:MAG: hypothetical protein KF819_22910 [Labilithrix sp.]|nr:hypothetical protein [Labilithrix sp.]